MRPMLYTMLCFIATSIISCTTLFNVFVRNTTGLPATLDIYLLDKTNMKTLPNKARVADKIVHFKAGYRKYFDSYQSVIWVDTSHFKFIMRPGTTVDLSDMTGIFVNGGNRRDILVTVTVNGKADTLVQGRNRTPDTFQFKGRIFSNSILYYDIK